MTLLALLNLLLFLLFLLCFLVHLALLQIMINNLNFAHISGDLHRFVVLHWRIILFSCLAELVKLTIVLGLNN
jgi:hypothetical protein